jgi:hypothetical protein
MSQAAGDNNLIKIDTLLSQDGEYRIVVRNPSQNNLSRKYAMAFELLNPLAGDVNTDYVIDIDDVIKLAEYWLNTNCDNPSEDCYAYNLSPNTSIDLSDFSVLAENWMSYDSRYYTPPD